MWFATGSIFTHDTLNPMKLRDSIRLYGLFNFAFSFDLYAAIKVIIFYRLTHSYSTAAGLISLTLLSSALAEVPTGLFSDLIGRNRTIILGSFSILMSYILFALRFDYIFLTIGAVIEGVGLALFNGNNNAYLHNLLSDENKQKDYHHHYGHMMSINTFSSVVGVFVGGWIATWSVSFLLWINLIPKSVCFITSLALKDVTRQDHLDTNIYNHLHGAIREIKQNKTLRYASLSTILGGGGFAAGELQAAAFAVVWPTWAVGLAKGIQAIAGIPGYYYAGKLIDKFGVVRIMVAGLTMSVLGNVLTGLVRSVVSPLFVMFSLPLYGPSDTAEQLILQREFTERQRATIASLNSLGNSLSASVVLYICGIIANHYGPFIALLSTQVFLIPAIYFQSLFFRAVSSSK